MGKYSHLADEMRRPDSSFFRRYGRLLVNDPEFRREYNENRDPEYFREMISNQSNQATRRRLLLAYGLLRPPGMNKKKDSSPSPNSDYLKTEPVHSKDIPATKAMLSAVRDELKADIKTVDHKVGALETKVDLRFDQVDKRFEQVDKRFEQVDKRFDELVEQMNSKFAEMESRMESHFHRLSLLMEEQRSHNNYALDGFNMSEARHDRLEARMDGLESQWNAVLRVEKKS